MADMLEYYQQIGELKKAVRERELHRLELEKQALLSAQGRERRHEDFKDKIRDIQRELAQKEKEASQNFQSLLARVESIRREHQLLAAHTEQLRQRKLQYEMSLRNANPILHTTVPQDLSGLFGNLDDAAWKRNFQATNPSFSKPPLQPHSLPPQTLVSPTTSYNPSSTGHMSMQPMDRHIPRGGNLMSNQQQPYAAPMTNLSMTSASLTEESLPHSRTLSHTQQDSMMKTLPTYNQSSHVDYRIPQDISRRAPPHGEMVLHPHGNMIKTSPRYSQSSHIDHRIPQVSREPLTTSHVSRGPLNHDGMALQSQGYTANTPIISNHPSHADYIIPQVSRESLNQHEVFMAPNNNQLNNQSLTQDNIANTPIIQQQPSLGHYTVPHAYRDPLTHSGMVSPTHGNTSNAPMTHSHPSHQGHMIPDDIYKTGIHQNHPTIQPVPRDPPEYNRSLNMTGSRIQSDLLSTNTPISSLPFPLQSGPYTDGTDINYLQNQPHSIPQAQHLSGISSLPTNAYHPKMHTNLPTGPANGVSHYSPPKSILEGNFESEYMSPHLKTSSHDSLPHQTQLLSSNNTLPPESHTPYSRATVPSSMEIYNAQSNLLVKREMPEKDTSISRGSISRQDPVEVDEVSKNLGEEELNNKPFTIPNVDDKPREMSSSRKYHDERTHNDSPKQDENRNGNYSTSKPYVALTHDNTMKDREYNYGKTTTPERSTTHNSPLTSTEMEAKNELKSQRKPSLLSASEASVNIQPENYHNPSRDQTTENTNSLLESKPVKTIDTTASKDVYNSEMDNRRTSLTQHQNENNQEDHKFPDTERSSPKDMPSPASIKYSSPDKQSSSSQASSSLASTRNSPTRTPSARQPEVSQEELKNLDRHSSFSRESPPTTKSNTRPTTAVPSKPLIQNVGHNDTDFFDQDINVTDSAAYKSLVGNTRKGSDVTDSEIDEAEGQVSAIISKPQTPLSRPVIKPFAASIPSLRPRPPDTDTDSVDSVEAAIQAAMKKKDIEAVAESSGETPHPPPSMKHETRSEKAAEEIKSLPVKPGIDKITGKKTQNTAAALQINLDSECESYEVSAGGEASDEDDFDFYDKF